MRLFRGTNDKEIILNAFEGCKPLKENVMKLSFLYGKADVCTVTTFCKNCFFEGGAGGSMNSMTMFMDLSRVQGPQECPGKLSQATEVLLCLLLLFLQFVWEGMLGC